MPVTSALQTIPLPATSDAPTVPADLLAFANYAEKRLVMRFNDATQRDSTVTAPENGMVAYLRTPKVFTFHDGTGWFNMQSNLLSPVVQSVDSVNSGGQVTLTGAGSNKSWGVKSQAGTLVFRYDFTGSAADILTLSQTAVTIATGKLFVKDGVTQPTLRSGSGAPNNAVGVDGDWYARF